MEFAAQLPVNGLSFGQVSLSILKEFHKRGLEPCLFPINEDISSFSFDKDFVDWIKGCIKKSPQKHKRDNPSVMLWHLNATALNNVSNKSVLLSFYELDSPTPSEINIASNFSKVAFTSKDSIKTFSDYGISSEYVPLGFDSNHFKKLDKKYYDDGRIVFNLCGKLEKRKRHNKIIKAWVKKYGNNKKYHLQCAIHNPFLAKEMPGLINRILEGKKYFNIQFLDHMTKNITYNDFLNSGDIVLGMSGGEGWGLPEFHSVAIGKHAVIMNATGYKEWASKENSVLVSPSSKISSVDGVFFNEGAEYNQGKIYDFDEDSFINGCEEAIKRVESNKINKEGLKLQDKFTYSKTTDKILKLIKDA
jgi:glycosyltransferase involved in cell wall biosynthesis